MAADSIYVWENGVYDLSRWLDISTRTQDMCMLHLTELCQPGRLTSRGNVPVNLEALESAVRRGALQLTFPMGYLALHRVDDLVVVEFKSHDDLDATVVTLKAPDMIERIDFVKSQAQQNA